MNVNVNTMKIASALFWSISLLTFSACNAPESKTAESARTPKREAGNWTMTHTTIAFDATGVTGAMADLVAAGKSSIGEKDVSEPICLTAAEVEGDTLNTRLNEMVQFGPEWKVTRSDLSADGKVDFAANMDDPSMGKGTMTVTGTISPTKTDLVMTTDSYEPAPGKGHIHTVIRQENTRIGACD